MSIPIRPDGTPMVTFEVKIRKGKNDKMEKSIFIDGEMLDWSVDLSSLMEAMSMGPKYFKVIQRDIERHFVESVSEFLARKVTAEDIKQAIQTGWI